MNPWFIIALVFGALAISTSAVTLGATASNDGNVSETITPAPENTDMPNPSTNDPNVSPGVSDLADAIAHAEGFGVAGAIPTRANNPGDLVMPNWKGGSLGAERISVFATIEQGWIALYHQLQLIESGKSHVYTSSMTIGEMADKWTATDKPEWAANVARFLANHGYPGVDANTTLDEILFA